MKPFFILLWAAVCPITLLASDAVSAPGVPQRGSHSPTAGVSNTSPAPGFSLVASPATITLAPSGAVQGLTVAAFPANGFTGSITVKFGTLPAGVTAAPASLTLTAGSLGVVNLSASSTAAAGTSKIAVTGTSGTVTGNTTFSLTVSPAMTSAVLSNTFLDFGNDLVNHQVTKNAVTITNIGLNTLTLNPALSGDASFSIVSVSGASCGTQLLAGQRCSVYVSYDPKTPSGASGQKATLNMNLGNVPLYTQQRVAITGTSFVLAPGVVTATDNSQVALYTMNLPFPGKMKVNFGQLKTYGRQTWLQSSSDTGGPVSIFVAGMEQNKVYHMAAMVEFDNGIVVNDSDHTFKAGFSLPPVYKLSGVTAPGMKPQPGLELLNPLGGVEVVELGGQTLWTWANPGSLHKNITYGVKQLADGNMLMTIGGLSDDGLGAPLPAGIIIEIREVNLAGDTVRELTIDDLNAELPFAPSTCVECANLALVTFHHDVEPLPNGHWLVLANAIMKLSPTSTPPLTNAPPVNVSGDVIVDLDENLQPVWAWNSFNHLDPNRHPMAFPDWTHANAVVYSPDDGNIIFSMRHQNWVIKINYANGTGDGKVLWRLGQGGDFKLVGGTEPADWNYAQHEPAFFSPNSSGVFKLGLMDNGNDRGAPVNGLNPICGTAGAPACYTTIPIYQIDEVGETATLTFHQKLPANLYSYFGGNVTALANGDVEYDDCSPPNGMSYVAEVTQETPPQTVWSMRGGAFYRAFRIQSLYPGVKW